MDPVHILIIGKTKSGKTHYLLEMIEKEYAQKFGNIFLICPTFKWNTTYRNWKYINDSNFFVIPCSHDQVDSSLKFVVDYCKGIPSLIILDDCAQGNDVKNRTSELVGLGFSGRHMFISTAVLSQQLTSITKPYRDNLSKVVVFHSSSKKNMKMVFDDFLDVSSEEEASIKKTLKKFKYCRLEIELDFPSSHKLVVPDQDV